MSNFQLKLIALITMTIDHIGFIMMSPYDPNYVLFRSIGRLAFVIFAFLTTEGVLKTRNQSRYIFVLLTFAFVIDIPRLFLGFDYFGNVFYTLGLGALVIAINQKTDHYGIKAIVLADFALVANVIGADYGAFGVIAIYLIAFARELADDRRVVRELIMMALFYFLIIIMDEPDIEKYGLISFFIIMLYNGSRGFYNKYSKYLIYIYYPLHLVFLTWLSYVL